MCPLNESQAVLCGDLLDPKDDEENDETKRGGGGGGEEEEEEDDEDEDEIINGIFQRVTMSEVAEELTLLGKIAGPILMTSLLLYSRSIISMLFLGHLGDVELAGGSLAIGFANITGHSVMRGLAMGMEPICCQAYGAKRWVVLSQTYRRSVFLQLLATIPISLLWLYMEPILLWLGQDPIITSTAKVYITFSLPDLLAQAHLHPVRTFLRTQGLTTPLTLTATCAMALHLPINYFLVIHLNLGVRGVALAAAWNTLNLNLGLLLYLLLSKTSVKPWDGSIVSCFQGWRPLLVLTLPSVLSVCLEWWWYEIMLLLCGLLTNPQASVAATGILMQTTSLIYAFPYSLSLGLSTRVGHELGAGRPTRAQWATIIGLFVAVVCGLSAFAFTTAVRYTWGKMYTAEHEILKLTSTVLPILGFCELGNCPQTTACGALMGTARPKVGANINFGSFYLIGLPVAVIMGFWLKIGLMGLWFGLVAAQASCMCMMMYTLFHTDWKYQAKRAMELTQTAERNQDDLEASLLN